MIRRSILVLNFEKKLLAPKKNVPQRKQTGARGPSVPDTEECRQRILTSYKIHLN